MTTQVPNQTPEPVQFPEFPITEDFSEEPKRPSISGDGPESEEELIQLESILARFNS